MQEKTPKSSKNGMLTFGLCSTSDDQPGCLMDSNPIHQPSPAKKGKSILGLHSTSGDRLSNPSNKSQLKCDKRPPKSLKNEIFIFINYVQLLMIDQVIQATKVDQMQKRTPKSSKNEMLIFGLHSTSDDWPGWSMDLNLSATPLQPKK